MSRLFLPLGLTWFLCLSGSGQLSAEERTTAAKTVGTKAVLGLGVELAHSPNTGTKIHIGSVSPGGPGAAAGLKPGDTILAINGRPIAAKHPLDLYSASAFQPGVPAMLRVARQDLELTLEITPGFASAKDLSNFEEFSAYVRTNCPEGGCMPPCADQPIRKGSLVTKALAKSPSRRLVLDIFPESTPGQARVLLDGAPFEQNLRLGDEELFKDNAKAIEKIFAAGRRVRIEIERSGERGFTYRWLEPSSSELAALLSAP